MADDMISKLPDVLIQQILSFLPTKEAVRTSILSRRWEFLWTSSPNLVFDNLNHEEDNNFVDRALFLRESRVKKFSISFEYAASPEQVMDCSVHLRQWITDIVRLHVEDLHLDLSERDLEDSFEFPNGLFTCASLSSFSLHTRYEFRVPPSTNLSNLKNLVLEYVTFIDAQTVDHLFNGCPLLETASLISCTFMCDCRISAPNLYKLVIEDADWDDARNIMIFGPSLKFFHLRGEFINSYCLNDQPSLDEAEISIQYEQPFFDETKWEAFVFRFYKLLKGLPLVKKLSLSSQALEALSHQGNLPAEVPFFSNLFVLSFNGREPIGLDLDHNDLSAYFRDGFIGLMRILQNSPYIETLRFEMGITLYTDREEYERILVPVPLCFLSTLKTLEILVENDGDYLELFMNAAELLLERASVLEKLILYASKSFEVSRMYREKLIKALNKLPRASKLCQFEFSDFEMKSI